MKTVLHLTCDFPDPMMGAKTRGVLNFVENTPGIRHVVYSLNRASWKSNIVSVPFGEDRVAVAYGAPPKGILLETRLRRVAEWIKQDLRRKGTRIDMIHAHKLTIEGLIALDLHKELGIPYVCSIWGDTDLKVMRFRRDLRRRWQEIMADAQRILPCAPWTAELFCRDYGLDSAKVELLLPIVRHERSITATVSPQPRFVSLFNLNVHRRKNLEGLIKAMVQAAKVRPGIALDVYGSGSAATLCEIDEMIRSLGASSLVQIKGPLADAEFETVLNGYTAFVMPTLRETFGMVFVEALFCGLPILYTRNWSIDGLFPADRVGYAWDGKSNADITRGLLHLAAEESALKESINTLAASGEFDRLTRDSIIAGYRRMLDSVMGAGPSPAR